MTTRRAVRRKALAPSWGAMPAVVLVGGLSVAALFGIISRSFRPGSIVGGEYGTDAWQRVLADGAFWDAVVFTLRAALIATPLAVMLALPIGIAARSAGPWTRALLAALIPVPHLVVASTTVTWFGPGQLLDRILGTAPIVGDRFGVGVILVYLIKEIPFLVLLVMATLDEDTLRLDEAAQGLGASWWPRLRHILLPRLALPLGIGALVVAAFVIGSTEVPLAIGPLVPDSMTTYSITVQRIRGPIARADSAVALAITTVVIIALGAVALGVARRRT